MKTITKLMLGLALIAGYSLSSLYAGGNGNGNGNNNAGSEVTGELVQPPGSVTVGGTPTIGWLINRPPGHTNNGHGNNVDGVDGSNPGGGGGGPNGEVDPSGDTDDEIRGGDPDSNLAIGPNEIRQIDNDSGIQRFSDPGDDEGTLVTLLPISPAGSEFELWGNIQGDLIFLDNMVVLGDPPTATFTVTTQDPWIGSEAVVINGQNVSQDIYRTRADLAFSTTATVAGLSMNPTDPLLARQLDLFHEGDDAKFVWMDANGDPVMDYDLLADNNQGPFVIATEVVDNNSTYSWSGLSRLTGYDPTDGTTKVGVERITVQSIGGEWPNPADPLNPFTINPWRVDSASVIVWPVATGFFNQMNNDQTAFVPFVDDQNFIKDLPFIYVNYRDLYPGSISFVQVYKGPHVQGQVGMPIVAVTRVPGVGVSQARIDALEQGIAYNSVEEGTVIRAADIQEHVNYLGNGQYTLEILSGGIPWMNGGAYMSLAHITFQVNQSVKVRGQIGTK